MIKVRQIASGIIWNWIALVTSAAVALFLSPFVVHHLGQVVYGVWVLINSTLAYMSLLDLGMRGAVTRFLSRDRTQGLHAQCSETVSAALWVRAGFGGVILLASLVMAYFIGHLFHVPPELVREAQIVLVITGANVAMGLVFGVFGAVLGALQRFDLMSGVSIGQTLLNGAGLVWLLSTGHGLVAMSVYLLCVGFGASLILMVLARRTYPELRIEFRRPGWSVLRALSGYSLLIFLINMSTQVIYYTDILVVAAFLPVAAVTSYAIGSSLLEYLRQIIASMATTFMPAASALDAQGKRDALRTLLVHGTRTTLLVALPIEAGLFLRGETFISLWMGPQYGPVSSHILRILLLAWLFVEANHCSANIVFGMSKHRPMAIWMTCEAFANLGLSVFLVRRIGITGVAWGTVIPSMMVTVVLWPRYICSLLGIHLATYFWQSWIKPMLALLPFALGCYLADLHWAPHSVGEFLLQMLALMPLYAIAVALMFGSDLRSYLDSALAPASRLRGWIPLGIAGVRADNQSA